MIGHMSRTEQNARSLAEVMDSSLLTQQELAIRSGLSLASVSKAVRGKGVISRRTARKIEAALGEPVAWPADFVEQARHKRTASSQPTTTK